MLGSWNGSLTSCIVRSVSSIMSLEGMLSASDSNSLMGAISELGGLFISSITLSKSSSSSICEANSLGISRSERPKDGLRYYRASNGVIPMVFFSSWTRLTYLTQYKSFELSLILEASAFLRSQFARST